MKVGIIGAMEQEVALLREKMVDSQTVSLAGCEIYNGKFNQHDIVLLKSGVGKTASALSTSLMLEKYKPDIVINTGTAGGLKTDLQPGDIVVSSEVGYHDVDVTAFGYDPGQMARCPPFFTADKWLISLVNQAIAINAFNAKHGLIVSGDIFLNGAKPLEKLTQSFPHAVAVDMESASIGHVCHLFNTPFVITRAISDVADKKSHLNFNAFITLASHNSSQIVITLLEQLPAHFSRT